MKKKSSKKWVIAFGIVILIVIALIVIPKLGSSGVPTGGGGGQVEIVPLSQDQINIVGQTVLSSAFVGDLPSKGVIALQFYDFVDGQRVWQSGFLIGKEGFLSSGVPDMVLIMHTKYITELNQKDLCEVVQSAQANNDMWVESELSNAKLFLRYAGMMKYRDCFGF